MLAIAVVHSTDLLPVTPPSRASSLSHWFCVVQMSKMLPFPAASFCTRRISRSHAFRTQR
ncbi:hypothetical protein C1X61_22425 [Pseudomonas sp. FW215-T2]|nr:hypothetical protein C1X61_22425 [Pseudomonas sp. FW215-T2]PNA11229.1 hypothetical protein C1X62_15710 [Pseudomonas sp. FW215-R3]PNB37058.1 hypothetical protein C1X63_14355 [Pseudomonas sp. FW305-131]